MECVCENGKWVVKIDTDTPSISNGPRIGFKPDGYNPDEYDPEFVGPPRVPKPWWHPWPAPWKGKAPNDKAYLLDWEDWLDRTRDTIDKYILP